MATTITTPATLTIERIHPHYPIHLERSITANTPAPTVILLGWIDSQLKQLSKGALYYRFRGYNIIYCHTDKSLIWFPSQIKRIVSALIPTLESLGVVIPSPVGSSSPIIFQSPATSPSPPALVLHVFSNGGCLSLWALLSTLRANNLALRTPRVIIFDSSPGFGSILALSRVYTVGLKSPLYRALIWTLLLIGYAFLFVPYQLCLRLTRRTVFKDAVMDVMKDPNINSVPRLFLYSIKDQAVPFKAIEVFVKQAERLSGKAEDGKQERAVIRTVRFEETGHVQHWIDERSKEKYWRAIDGML
ncbi:hypothetical protein BC937DRAFT_89613 [Endogone sp. FLAS-F59071]|nr:hypothetical protein BC937DRAFT_89613 [Endogone sp. FLAS-F59071]|eukprot:RUS17687.1 hypothetical protein BC937DRAFT_89613 [Endogone sp. FLAS-F59071]